MTAHEEVLEAAYLERYSAKPIYNTKAVVQQTGVPAPTLRAWERRYALISPTRAENSYRLYSERDIVLIRWLKERIESGFSISQAIALFKHHSEEHPNHLPQGGIDLLATFPENPPTFNVAVMPPSPRSEPRTTTPAIQKAEAAIQPQYRNTNGAKPALPALHPLHDLNTIQNQLIAAFQLLDEATANMLMGTLMTVYSVEDICAEVITPTLWKVGQYWAEGKVTISVEHFASNFFRALLTNLYHLTPGPRHGSLVIVCSAPGEPHELAALMLALMLRRQGERVAYLGQSIETTGLLHTIRQLSPALVCISLTIADYLTAFIHLARHMQQIQPNRPLLAFGGQGFNGYEEIIPQLPGTYLPGDLRESAERMYEMLHQ